MLFYVTVCTEEGRHHGVYVAAKNMTAAIETMEHKLQPGAHVSDVAKAYISMITPQSVCVNFRNRKEQVGYMAPEYETLAEDEIANKVERISNGNERHD